MNLRAQYTITEEQRIRLAAKPTRTAPNTFRKTAPSLLTHRSSGQFKRPGPSVGRVCPVPTQIHDPLVERFPLISSAPESVEASSCTTCQRQGQSALRETAAETIHIRHSLDATRVQGLYLPQACAREPRRMRLECLMLTARIHRRDKQQREKTTSVSPDGKVPEGEFLVQFLASLHLASIHWNHSDARSAAIDTPPWSLQGHNSHPVYKTIRDPWRLHQLSPHERYKALRAHRRRVIVRPGPGRAVSAGSRADPITRLPSLGLRCPHVILTPSLYPLPLHEDGSFPAAAPISRLARACHVFDCH